VPARSSLVFVCAHLCDERLYAPQIAALEADYDCSVYCFRAHDTMGGMAGELLAKAPPRFTLIGLSLGGYVALEVIRRELGRIERLVMMDTSADADTERHRAGRLADIAKVEDGGIEALVPELPSRWLHPAHAVRADLVELMGSMARSVGAEGERNQQLAMLARPDSHADLQRVAVPTLFVVGREDTARPISEHESMVACVPGSRFEIIEQCGHLSTIEQPEVVNRLLTSWLRETDAALASRQQ
jgi:pimeloyl-ACP methyl ester carboxylesterase